MNKQELRNKLQQMCNSFNDSSEIADMVERMNQEMVKLGDDFYVTMKCILVKVKNGRDRLVIRTENHYGTFTDVSEQIMVPKV